MQDNTLELLSTTRSFGGWIKRYKHVSSSTNTDMIFAIYLPPQAEHQKVPVLYWLSGLTCTDENFMQKAGAQRVAAELGLAIVCPDTSPRGTDLLGEHDSYDLGSGAGFYVNATQAPWSEHYRMYDYVTSELPAIVAAHFPVTERCSISGHSMGGHGALICALKNPEQYESVSAFAPITNPVNCPWGEKAFTTYLGDNKETWLEWDACELLRAADFALPPLLVDQGLDDNFMLEQLKPEALEKVCAEQNISIQLRKHEHYDHSYFFIASFIEEHLRFHAAALSAVN